MSGPLVFISYKHADPSSMVATKLRDKLEVVSDGLGFRVFLDDEDLRAGDTWEQELQTALGEMSHFIALLSDDYWLSRECRKELAQAINRFEDGRRTRLLFVMVEEMRPDLLTLSRDRSSGRLASDDPQIQRIGDIHFLGPFDANKRLVRLEWENPARLRDQLKQLVDRFERTLSKKD